MCGIVGITGTPKVAHHLLEGLRRLDGRRVLVRRFAPAP